MNQKSVNRPFVNQSFRGDLNTQDLVGVFRNLGLEVKARADGKYYATCPWQHEHGETGKTDTVIWQDGSKWPTFHCSHNHCDGRDIHAVLEWAESNQPGIIDAHCSREWRTGQANRARAYRADAGPTNPKVKPFTPKGERAALPTDLADTTPIQYLLHDYSPDAFIRIVHKPNDEGKPSSGEIWTVREWAQIFKFQVKPEDFQTEHGVWYGINPLLDATGISDCDVANHKYVLIELEVSKDKRAEMNESQLEAASETFHGEILNSGLPLGPIYTSGGPSIHALVRIDAGDNAELYKKRVEQVYEFAETMPGFDRKNKNPARLSRLPGAFRNGKKQTLLAWGNGKSWCDWKPEMTQPEPNNQPDMRTDTRWPEVEGSAAGELHKCIGQVRCVGDDWYVQKDGVWLPTNRDLYRPMALEVLPTRWRTQARSIEVIKRLEGEHQVTRDQFCGAAKFDCDGSVLVAVQNGTLRIAPEKVEMLRLILLMALPPRYQ